MSGKPTGVFVRLPLSDEQRAKIVAEMMFAPISVSDAFSKAALNIGTPVTGGDIPVIGTIHIGENGKPFFTAPELYSVGGDVVRQSDHQAQIAALEAEIVRLRGVVATVRTSLAAGNRMKAAYVIETALKGGAA